jgi:hypothetical protein
MPRCPACGATTDAAAYRLSALSDPEAGKQNTTFSWKWVAIALLIFLVVQFPPIVLLDLDGWAGIGVAIGVWFLGGIIVGFISPGRTFVEPAVAAIIAAVPTMVYLQWTTPEGLGPETFHYVLAGVLGAGVGLFGARIGESIQGASRGRA